MQDTNTNIATHALADLPATALLGHMNPEGMSEPEPTFTVRDPETGETREVTQAQFRELTEQVRNGQAQHAIDAVGSQLEGMIEDLVAEMCDYHTPAELRHMLECYSVTTEVQTDLSAALSFEADPDLLKAARLKGVQGLDLRKRAEDVLQAACLIVAAGWERVSAMGLSEDGKPFPVHVIGCLMACQGYSEAMLQAVIRACALRGVDTIYENEVTTGKIAGLILAMASMAAPVKDSERAEQWTRLGFAWHGWNVSAPEQGEHGNWYVQVWTALPSKADRAEWYVGQGMPKTKHVSGHHVLEFEFRGDSADAATRAAFAGAALPWDEATCPR